MAWFKKYIYFSIIQPAPLQLGADSDGASDDCKTLEGDDIPWQSIAVGDFPDMECNDPYGAQISAVTAEVKPFCLAPDAYGGSESGLQACWPTDAPPSLGGGSDCEGFHSLEGIASSHSDTVLLVGLYRLRI
jgi:hypothetical protein